ncbi:unnamed protein product [Prunus armeniaca]
MRRAAFDWAKRFDIIQGVARGLVYLHHDSCLKVTDQKSITGLAFSHVLKVLVSSGSDSQKCDGGDEDDGGKTATIGRNLSHTTRPSIVLRGIP